MSEQSVENLSFETALQELEQLVGKMESGGLSLDELVKGFERGRILTGHCRAQLDAFERKITLLTRDDGGEGTWRDFDPSMQSTPESARSAAVYSDDVPF